MLRKLLVVAGGLVALTACVVEEVTVDTGGAAEAVDTATPAQAPSDRPDPDAGPGADSGGPDDGADDASPYVEPATAAPGETLLAFVVADGAADLSMAEEVLLYGEPDVTVATWAVRDADELALSLEVAEGSPEGPLDVVVELTDGGVFRVAEGLQISR